MGLNINIVKNLPGFRLDVSLAAERGIIGILGASGSGKSMLLRCISGLVKPDSGEITINGRTFFHKENKINLPPKDRRIGFLFQNYALFPTMTIEENISFGLSNMAKEEKKQKVRELMEKFRLLGMEDRRPHQISGGQQQRAALARAMAVEPEILLLDEPFSALDNHLRNHMIKEMLEFLKEFQGIALFVTHNMEEAYRLTQSIAILNAGKVEAFGPKRELFQNPVSIETARITGCKNLAPGKSYQGHEIGVPDWGGIRLKTTMKTEDREGYAGIRANHIKLAENGSSDSSPNRYPVWIADESETPFRTTLYLKIGSRSGYPEDYHVLWEISREQRDEVSRLPQPFYIQMPPENVFFVEG